MIALDITAVTLIFSNSRNIIITMILTKLALPYPWMIGLRVDKTSLVYHSVQIAMG